MSKRPAILITGGAKRIGRELALYFAQAGYDIALHYNYSSADALVTQEEARKHGVECELVQTDLSKLEVLEEMMHRVMTRFPNCRTIIHNASIFERGTVMESKLASYRRHFDINFAAPAFLTQAFVQHQKQGNIIFILDDAILEPAHAYAFYLLSKKSLAELTKMLAVELAPGIRVNGVAPGHILPSSDGQWDASYLEKRTKHALLKRLATPQDIAVACEFLMFSQAMTGQILYVDGGEHLQ